MAKWRPTSLFVYCLYCICCLLLGVELRPTQMVLALHYFMGKSRKLYRCVKCLIYINWGMLEISKFKLFFTNHNVTFESWWLKKKKKKSIIINCKNHQGVIQELRINFRSVFHTTHSTFDSWRWWITRHVKLKCLCEYFQLQKNELSWWNQQPLF